MFSFLGTTSTAPNVLTGNAASSQMAMKAAYYTVHGDENVIKVSDRMSRPTLQDNQFLVKVSTSAVNPVDVKLRENNMPVLFLPLPKIIGSDLYGTVVEKGKSANEKFKVGDKVIAMMPHVFSGWGSACEYAAVDDSYLALAPTNITPEEAGSLPLVSLTVFQALQPFVDFHKGATAGRSVLIQAGAGGLGTFAIQYCKHALGMKVFATCSAGNAELLQGLGADVVIDYATQRFEDVAVGMDLVFDPMAYLYEGRTFNSAVLKNKGSFYVNIPSSYHALTPTYMDPLRMTIPEAAPHRMAQGYGAVYLRGALARLGFPVAQYVFQYVHPDGAALGAVARLVEEGKVRPVVEPGDVFPLDEVAAAHRKVREGHVRGKVVLKVVE